MQSLPSPRAPAHAGDVLTLGFAITVAMWLVGYVCHMPLVTAPPEITLALLLLCLLAGGWLTGRVLSGGWRRVTAVGLVAGTLNLLIVGSVVARESGEGTTGTVEPALMLWAPGSVLVSAVLVWLGAALARRARAAPPAPASRNWPGLFAVVTICATSLLVVAGGLVTGSEAGLAVHDWPTSFASNMFLLPLSRMTGAVYYEHAHRLLGALVGLTTVALAVLLWRSDDRRWVKRLALLAVIMVVGQGLLGGFRVISASVPEGGVAHVRATDETDVSVVLRIVHGVLAQLFFCLVVALAAFTSRTWRALPPPRQSRGARVDRALVVAGAGALLVQLVLGALVRHLGELDHSTRQQLLSIHMGFAAGVAMLLVIAASRAWGRYPDLPAIGRLGPLVILVVTLQVLLGMAALSVTAWAGSGLEVVATVTTFHQATGAALLGFTVLLVLWVFRQVREDLAGAA